MNLEWGLKCRGLGSECELAYSQCLGIEKRMQRDCSVCVRERERKSVCMCAWCKFTGD